MTSTLIRFHTGIQDRLRRTVARARDDHARNDHARDDRGDIPGWVMVVLMTAAIVAAVWALAEPALTRLFNDAIDDVSR